MKSLQASNVLVTAITSDKLFGDAHQVRNPTTTLSLELLSLLDAAHMLPKQCIELRHWNCLGTVKRRRTSKVNRVFSDSKQDIWMHTIAIPL